MTPHVSFFITEAVFYLPPKEFMGDAFQPRLVNGPFDDPALLVDFRYERRALLFDLGQIDSLSTRELLRLSDVFVSHTHIDHFIGFDHLLRSSLNRESEIRLFGPKGIIDNVHGKLAGYTWNLIQDYPLRIVVHEIDQRQQKTVHLHATTGFQPKGEAISPFDGVLLNEPSFTVSAAILDHRVPCLAFCLKEKTRLNIRPDRLQTMGLKSGPWLDHLKRMIRENEPETTRLEIPVSNSGGKKGLALKEWREALVLEREGQKIVYVADCLFSPANVKRIVSLAQDVDLFYCEATFSQADEPRARERYHLTAAQAGTLARLARAKHLIPFHFSPRYEAEPKRLLEEAMEKFANP
ncbi:MAG: MBL fold metallo-hydrolase [Candidatus Binatia bacterium]